MKKNLIILIILMTNGLLSNAQVISKINGEDTVCISQPSSYSVTLSTLENKYLFRAY